MKKFLGLCMALCLCLVLLPATALAAEEMRLILFMWEIQMLDKGARYHLLEYK